MYVCTYARVESVQPSAQDFRYVIALYGHLQLCTVFSSTSTIVITLFEYVSTFTAVLSQWLEFNMEKKVASIDSSQAFLGFPQAFKEK